MNSNDDALYFMDEPGLDSTPLPLWHVLLVDDEPDVHVATQLALKNLTIEGRGLVFTSAYSAAQAMSFLPHNHSFAVAIVDVVMETDDAGLRLIEYIRKTLNDSALRIILRTGQPGYAPEIDTITAYDINDYRTKTEFTQTRLFTSLTMAIRSYAQIQQLDAHREGLEQVLVATTELSKLVGLSKFFSGIATQLCALLKIDIECLVCAALDETSGTPYILAAAGSYSHWVDLPIADIPEERVKQGLATTLRTRQHSFTDRICLFFAGRNQQALAAFVDTHKSLDELEQNLLEVFCSNISIAFENQQLYLAINELAFNDSLVQLPNRNGLINKIEVEHSNKHVLALLDIDNFSDINSILDSHFGDAVLQAVATRLRASFSEATLVARLGSDLFGLYGTHQEVNPESIHQVFAAPFNINNTDPLRITVTSGLALWSDKGETSIAILKNAGAALKQAKRSRRGKELYFEATQTISARDRINLLNQLRSSFLEQCLELYYQPFVSLKHRRVLGAECLLRWKTPNDNFISPEIFIPIAEQSGLMIPIGEWVVRTALKWRKSLGNQVTNDFRVAINVSQAQFSEPDFVVKFLTLLREANVPSSQVEIELTESIAIENIEQLSSKLNELQRAGVHLAMDDFGTGYSSLSVLQRLKLNRLKIDRCFVSGIEAANSYNMASTIIAMAKHLKLATIGEGIETEEQCAALLAAGCQDGQGYLFSRPLPETEFLPWLAQFNAAHS